MTAVLSLRTDCSTRITAKKHPPWGLADLRNGKSYVAGVRGAMNQSSKERTLCQQIRGLEFHDLRFVTARERERETGLTLLCLGCTRNKDKTQNADLAADPIAP